MAMTRPQVIDLNDGVHVIAVPTPFGGYEIRTSEGERIGRVRKHTTGGRFPRTVWDYSTAAGEGEWGCGEARSLSQACEDLIARHRRGGTP